MSPNLDKSTWTRIVFGDVVANINDYFDPARDGALPYVAGPHIHLGEVSVARYGSTADDDFPPTFKRKFRSGDVLLHSRGIEKLVSVDRAGVTGEKLFVLRSKDESLLIQPFLVWLLLSRQAQTHMQENFTGSVNKFLNWKPLAAMQLDLPPFEEQKRIADLLWAVERHHAATRATHSLLLATLDLSLPAILFRQAGGPRPIGELASVRHGFAFPSSGFSEDLVFPTVVTPGNFAIGGGFQTAQPKTFSGEYGPQLVLAPGDVIVTMTDLSKAGDTLGYSAVVPEGRTYLHNQRIGKVVVRPGAPVLPEFLAWVLRTKEYRDYILQTAAGSTVRHTSPTRIEEYVVRLPDESAQRTALKEIDDLLVAKSALGGQRACLDDLKAALLAEAFGGR